LEYMERERLEFEDQMRNWRREKIWRGTAKI
jgi:ribosomal protein L39E